MKVNYGFQNGYDFWTINKWTIINLIKRTLTLN
jgi:hypothetical protein